MNRAEPASNSASPPIRWWRIAATAIFYTTISFLIAWPRHSFLAALIEGTGLLAIFGAAGVAITTVESRLHGRARLWGRIAEFSVTMGIILLVFSWSSGPIYLFMAGIFWAAVTGGLAALMVLRSDATS